MGSSLGHGVVVCGLDGVRVVDVGGWFVVSEVVEELFLHGALLEVLLLGGLGGLLKGVLVGVVGAFEDGGGGDVVVVVIVK